MIELNLKEVLSNYPPHEQGMILAERAVKSTVVSLVMKEDKKKGGRMTPLEASNYIKEEHPEYTDKIMETLADCCKKENPKIYKKAKRWLINNDNLINEWKEEVLEFYCLDQRIINPIRKKKDH